MDRQECQKWKSGRRSAAL